MTWIVSIDGVPVGTLIAQTRAAALRLAHRTFRVWGVYDVALLGRVETTPATKRRPRPQPVPVAAHGPDAYATHRAR